VRIDYVNADGNPSTRAIKNVPLDGTVITAWCRLREDARLLGRRIAAVTSA
jgi:predicted DNA-binding transcriptional regulator YafY